MHHSDVSLLGQSVVVLINKNLIDSSGLDIGRLQVSLLVDAQQSFPMVQMEVLPGSNMKSSSCYGLWLLLYGYCYNEEQ